MLTSHDGVVVWQREGGERLYKPLCCASLACHPREGWEFEPLLVEVVMAEAVQHDHQKALTRTYGRCQATNTQVHDQ